MTTAHAAAAKLIRAELKKNGIKASVRATRYSGGSSININVTDQLPETVEAIRAFTNKFKYGHFDPMTDTYEISNSRDDVPQVSYISVINTLSNELREAAWNYGRAKFADMSDAPEYKDSRNAKPEQLDCHRKILSGHWGDFWATRKPRQAA